MAVTPLVWDVNADADVLDIAALTPSDGDMLYWATGGTRYNTVPSTSYMRGLLNTASEAALKAAVNLEIGVDVQAYDADLTTWAGLTPSAYFQTLVDDADAATARATLGLSIGSQVQAYDADLSTWAGVTPGTGVATALAVAVGSAGAVVVNGGALGTPSSGTLTSATGLPISTGVSGLGTGIATALAINTGSAGAPVLVNGALGTPSSGTLTNATGLPVGGISGLGTGVATFLATPSSANLAAAVTDETGSGALYFTGGALGTPASATLTNATGLPVSGITASTSTALGVGSIELGHASDTTLSRVSAGRMAVEGSNVLMASDVGTSGTKLPYLDGANTWSAAQTFSASPVLNHGTAIGTVFQKSSVNKWVSGVAAGTGIGDNYEIYNYTQGGNSLVLSSASYAAAFTGPITSGGVAIPTISSTDTLSNKTLSSPTLSGTTTCGAINVSAASVAATINSTNNAYVLGISYASTTGGYIGTTSAGNLRLTDSTLTTMLDVNTAKVVTTGTLQANKITSAASPDTSSNSITNVIFRVAGSNVGAAGYGIDMGVSNTDGTSWIQSRDHNNYATNTTLKLNPNGGGATLGGVAVPTISSTDTLTNKTLSSPTLSGTVAGAASWSALQTFTANVRNSGTLPKLYTRETDAASNEKDWIFYAQSGAFVFAAMDEGETSYSNAIQISRSGATVIDVNFGVGVTIGSPTGGNKGAGTLNCTGAYDDNVLLTDLVLDYAVTNTFDAVKYVNHPLKDQVAPWWFDPDQYAEFWKAERRLPGMITWDDPADKPSTGESITRLTAVVEMQAALIENLNQRLKELEQ